jgi:hypothetical protein
MLRLGPCITMIFIDKILLFLCLAWIIQPFNKAFVKMNFFMTLKVFEAYEDFV